MNKPTKRILNFDTEKKIRENYAKVIEEINKSVSW